MGSQCLFMCDFILSWTDSSSFVTGLHSLGVWGFSERNGLRAPQGRKRMRKVQVGM